MDAPLVSVCMTTYNHEACLVQAIEGVLAQQTSFGVELVLGEDCSCDRTAEICRAYVEKYPGRIRLVTGERNVGWRANYRRTIAACRGRYVAICDGDDWWCDPHKLQRQADLLESDPACGMCFTCTERFYPDKGRRTVFPPELYTDFSRMLVLNPVDNCSTLARRELIERYYAEVRPDLHPEWLTDDTPMWLWFAACSQIRFLEEVTAVHRVLTGSVSHGGNYRKRLAFNDSIWVINEWFDARYGASRRHAELLRRRATEALWLLSKEGTAAEYLARWMHDVVRHPRLLFNMAGYGFFVKRILFRKRI